MKIWRSSSPHRVMIAVQRHIFLDDHCIDSNRHGIGTAVEADHSTRGQNRFQRVAVTAFWYAVAHHSGRGFGPHQSYGYHKDREQNHDHVP